METLNFLLNNAIAMVGSPASRLFWLYLLTALIAAIISFRLYAGKPFTLGNFAHYAFPRESYTSPSARMDYFLILLRPLWLLILLAPLLISANAVAEVVTALLGGAGPTRDLGFWHIGAYSIAVLLAFDFGQYIAHYLMHRFWFLWEFHKVHHSAQVLNPVTAFRFHPLEDVLTLCINATMIGIAKGVFVWLWGAKLISWQVMGLEAGIFIYYMAAYNLRHSQVWLAYPIWLSQIVQSPAQHQIHHSTAPCHWDKNIGFIFSFWDRMFGTLYIPREREELTYGLGGGEDAAYESPSKVYILPFRNIYILLKSGQPLPVMPLAKKKTARKEAHANSEP